MRLLGVENIDTALLLRVKFDKGAVVLDEEINTLLEQSKVVQKLTKDFEENAFFNLFRLMCLSEIPFIERFPIRRKCWLLFLNICLWRRDFLIQVT